MAGVPRPVEILHAAPEGGYEPSSGGSHGNIFARAAHGFAQMPTGAKIVLVGAVGAVAVLGYLTFKQNSSSSSNSNSGASGTQGDGSSPFSTWGGNSQGSSSATGGDSSSSGTTSGATNGQGAMPGSPGSSPAPGYTGAMPGSSAPAPVVTPAIVAVSAPISSPFVAPTIAAAATPTSAARPIALTPINSLGLAGNTGTVGRPITNYVGTPVRVPVNVRPIYNPQPAPAPTHTYVAAARPNPSTSVPNVGQALTSRLGRGGAYNGGYGQPIGGAQYGTTRRVQHPYESAARW